MKDSPFTFQLGDQTLTASTIDGLLKKLAGHREFTTGFRPFTDRHTEILRRPLAEFHLEEDLGDPGHSDGPFELEVYVKIHGTTEYVFIGTLSMEVRQMHRAVRSLFVSAGDQADYDLFMQESVCEKGSGSTPLGAMRALRMLLAVDQEAGGTAWA